MIKALGLVVALLVGAAHAQDPAAPRRPTEDPAPAAAAAAAADYRLPAAEILAFQFLLNRTNRYFGEGRDDYRVSGASIRRNLRSSWGTDRDPFLVNQLGHPYQGAIYHTIARSTGHDYWTSLGYAFAGSAVWEIAGEQTRPSRNDQIASGIGGTFLGEALFRMSSLILEKGAGLPPFWREVAAAAVSPATGFNRLAFGERHGRIFSSRDAAYFSRMQVGYAHSVSRHVGGSSADFEPNEAQLDFAIDYGLPGKGGYTYRRPFDYFSFQTTASSANGIESVFTRGLLLGAPYEIGPDFRAVWGLYGSFDYIAPQTFRVSSTGVSIGSTGQWWLGQRLSLQGTAMLGLGYAAVGTTHGPRDERAYNYGVAPRALLALRLTHAETVSLDVTVREFFVSNVASGTAGGRDNIVRGDASVTYRLARRHGVSVRVSGIRRDASFDGGGTRRQSQATIGVFYTLLGQDLFGVDDWR
jgi:hypothetical protein